MRTRILAMALLTAAPSAEAGAAPSMPVLRVTYTDAVSEDAGNGARIDLETFRIERGELHCKGSFIPSSSSDDTVPITDINGPRPDGLAKAEAAKAVAGLYLATLADYTRLNSRCFPRSAQTYAFSDAVFLLQDNIPYVAVANAPGGSTDPLPVVSFAAGSASTVEGGAPVDVLISLARPAARNVIVNLRITGTARNGKDYARIPKRVRILAGNVSAAVSIVPKRDRKAEGPETVTLAVRPSKRYGIAGESAVSVTIKE